MTLKDNLTKRNIIIIFYWLKVHFEEKKVNNHKNVEMWKKSHKYKRKLQINSERIKTRKHGLKAI